MFDNIYLIQLTTWRRTPNIAQSGGGYMDITSIIAMMLFPPFPLGMDFGEDADDMQMSRIIPSQWAVFITVALVGARLAVAVDLGEVIRTPAIADDLDDDHRPLVVAGPHDVTGLNHA